MLADLAFCPACGEPACTRSHGDSYFCRKCDLAGEITGFAPSWSL